MATLKRRDWLKHAALSALVGSVGIPSVGAQPVAPRAKRILYLFMAGAPSQFELLDHKPGLAGLRNTVLPDSVLGDKRISSLTSGQEALWVANPLVSFAQHGQSGMWFSELLPHMSQLADEFCLVKSMHTDAVNHEPANNLLFTGSQLPGKPSLGAWLSYGLGTLNPKLPSFVTLHSETLDVGTLQPLGKRLWSAAFMPASHAGVVLRPGPTPVLYLDDGLGLPLAPRKQLFDVVQQMNELHGTARGNSAALRRNDSYRLAELLQHSMADVADDSDEPQSVLDAYGPEVSIPGTYAANCLRARRLLERDVRVVMVTHRGWDAHSDTTKECRLLTQKTDQPTAALLQDLKARGLLDDTLVVWGGEFGRSVYSHGPITVTDHGRDHHAHCFPVLLAGAGVKKGFTYGETDDFSFNIVKDPVHVHDLQATILHIMGLDQHVLTYEHDGRNHRLTDLGGRIITDILS